ncbi:MAG TPA: hypothetical protein VEU74_00250 [Gemmatimonadales bacterium]|nr:hypothetical protein [Gemmatimonadales bacterium]
MTSTVRWARLRRPADCGLRVGAWYPVAALSATEVRVYVRGQLVRVPRTLVELRTAPPGEWTVVRGPFNAARVPASAREGYIVCPNCRSREPMPEERPAVRRCARCNTAARVAWSDVPAPAGVRVSSGRSDRRMTRRRSFGTRRRTPERRIADRRVLPLLGYNIEQRLGQRRSALSRRARADRRSGVERRRRVAAW